MSKDKQEDGVKRIVRKETKLPEHNPAPVQNPDQSESLGGCRDLFEDMWNNLEDYEDSKKE